MDDLAANCDSIDHRLAKRLRSLRTERAWSLDDLAGRSKVSRATLSRLENAEVSPTANVLGRLCAAYGLTMSRLMHMVEGDFEPLVSRAAQPEWRDPAIGFRRRSVSPPAPTLSGEALECCLDADTRIVYESAPKQGLEHHLLLIEGELEVVADDQTHSLQPGDCLRYKLYGSSGFATPRHSGARYFLFIV